MAGNAGGDEGRFGERRGWYFSGQQRPVMERRSCVSMFMAEKRKQKERRVRRWSTSSCDVRGVILAGTEVGRERGGGVGLAALMEKKRSKIKFGVCGCFRLYSTGIGGAAEMRITKGRRRKGK
ncbi:hypothetical protein HAX54_011207 [Datura stramonium]|uniref:Uncharacterized protein n=1 Tax=Datura stramonium TaxID=4076 RepID=A0ABS8Y4T0_DATST|nr:hypothetical protein [Datura stramonium]